MEDWYRALEHFSFLSKPTKAPEGEVSSLQTQSPARLDHKEPSSFPPTIANHRLKITSKSRTPRNANESLTYSVVIIRIRPCQKRNIIFYHISICEHHILFILIGVGY